MQAVGVYLIKLRIVNINFKTEIITKHWYSGINQLISVEFNKCTFKMIGPNAFDANAFDFLSYIYIYSMQNIHLGPIHKYTYLGIFIVNSTIQSIDNDMLTPIRERISSVYIVYFPNFEKTILLFEKRTFKSLLTVQIHGKNNDVNRSIDQNTFGRMPKIVILVLIRCGIEYIHPNTFDYIGRSLIQLRLEHNKLKTIEQRVFLTFLDTRSMEMYGKKLLTYNGNPLNCTCDLFEGNSLHHYLGNTFRAISTEPCNLTALDLSCNIQNISSQKMNIDCMEGKCNSPNIYNFPAVNMRVINHELVLRSNYALKFRLWIQSHGGFGIRMRTKCPTPEWLRNSGTCIFLSTTIQHMHIANFSVQWPITVFFAILSTSSKRVFPLHIQTFNYYASGDAAPSTWIFATEIICLLIGHLIGIASGIIFKIYYMDGTVYNQR